MDNIKTFLISNIKEITIDNIIYLDDNFKENRINLYDCAINYANYHNAHLNDYINHTPIDIEKNRCIGERDWFAKYPYFVFFSVPKIKFEIQCNKKFIDYFIKDYSKHKHYHEFLKIQLGLQQFNWYTFDLG